MAAPLVPLKPLGSGPSSVGMPSANRWCGCLPLDEDDEGETIEGQEGLYEEKLVHRFGRGGLRRTAGAGAVHLVMRRERRYGKGRLGSMRKSFTTKTRDMVPRAAWSGCVLGPLCVLPNHRREYAEHWENKAEERTLRYH